jgi:hypothetical protein
MMNKGDTVVYAQDYSIHGPPWNPVLIEMIVERDYGDTISVYVPNTTRLHLVSTDLVFPNMETAVKAVTMKILTIADDAESTAKTARWVANNWLAELKDFD